MTLLLIGLVGGIIAVAVWLLVPRDGRPESDAFSVEVRSAMVSDSGPITFNMVAYPSMFGETVSPVFYLVYIRITNLQGVPATVSEFKVGASNEAEGPYEDLVSIPLASTQLYSLGSATPFPKKLMMGGGTFRLGPSLTIDDMRSAAMLEVFPLLQVELAKPIPPHTPVGGWAAFDSLRRTGLTPGQIFFRVTLRDSANQGGRYVAASPIGHGVSDPFIDTDGDVFLSVTGVVTDISDFHLKYYGDPYPPADSFVPIKRTPLMLKLKDLLNRGAAIQQDFLDSGDGARLRKDFNSWDLEVATFLAAEKQLGKPYATQFRTAKPLSITLPTQDAKAKDIWALIAAKKLVISRILSELKQREK